MASAQHAKQVVERVAINVPSGFIPLFVVSRNILLFMNLVKGELVLRIPDVVLDKYVAHLGTNKIPPARFAEYRKWLR